MKAKKVDGSVNIGSHKEGSGQKYWVSSTWDQRNCTAAVIVLGDLKRMYIKVRNVKLQVKGLLDLIGDWAQRVTLSLLVTLH